jgi:cytochrome P450
MMDLQADESGLPTIIDLFGGTMMSPVPDPYSVYRRLRDEQPVIPLRSPMGISYMVTRYDDVLAVLKNNALFSSHANARGIGIVIGPTILDKDGQEHLRHRKIISPAFLPSALKGATAKKISEIAHLLIDEVAADNRADLVSQFTFTFPMRVIAHIIGIPMRDYAEFHRWALDLISVGDDPPRGFAAAQSIVDYLAPILEQRRAEPTGDLLSTLVHAEVDGDRLTEEEVLGFLRLLLPAGAETTYRLIGSILFALLSHREQREEVLADRSKLELVLEETLRWESPVQYVSREPTETVMLSGTEVPKGAMMTVAVGSANRDERRFVEPDRFDMHRNNDDHVAFGFGQHFCAGSQLARLEAHIALDALLDRLRNLRLDPREECQMVGMAFRSPDRLPVLFDA